MQEPQTRRRDAGLTLIELLTTISLIGIMTAVAATNFNAMGPRFQARAAALMIAGDLNQARMSAIKEGRVWEYVPVSGGYRIQRDDGAGGRVTIRTRSLFAEYPHVQFGHSSITQDPYGGALGGGSVPTGTITFQSNGTVQNPAGVFVQAQSGARLAQQAVTLSAAGRVRVWKWSGSAWK